MTGWHINDLTAETGAPGPASDSAGYVFDAQDTQHVVYAGADHHIHELWWNINGWHHNDLSAAAGAPDSADSGVASDPAGYVFAAQGTQHVVYLGADNDIHELWWDTDGWHHHDLSATAGAPDAAVAEPPTATRPMMPGGDPAGYAFDAQGTQHVVYTGGDHHIHGNLNRRRPSRDVIGTQPADHVKQPLPRLITKTRISLVLTHHGTPRPRVATNGC